MRKFSRHNLTFKVYVYLNLSGKFNLSHSSSVIGHIMDVPQSF